VLQGTELLMQRQLYLSEGSATGNLKTESLTRPIPLNTILRWIGGHPNTVE